MPGYGSMYCEHANECPHECPCPSRCYCRQEGSCRNRPLPAPTLPPEFAPVPTHTNFDNPSAFFEALRQHMRGGDHRVYLRPRRNEEAALFWCVRCGNTYGFSIDSYRRWLMTMGPARPIVSTLMGILLNDTGRPVDDWTEMVEAIDPVSQPPDGISVFDRLMGDDD